MMNRLYFGLILGIVSTFSGCADPDLKEDQPSEYYPVREDFMVFKVPESEPSKWHTPGYPPLLALNFADYEDPDVDKLRAEIKRRRIFNLREKVLPRHRQELRSVLTEYFGSPSAPHVLAADPEEEKYCNELLLDKNVLNEGGRLYRQYCLQCHGDTGNGNGPAGRFLQPTPRDYRQGKFKYLTSDSISLAAKLGQTETQRPRRDDLKKTIQRGLDGSPMPTFSGLTDKELDALVSYVIHLAIRGEVEYRLLGSYMLEAIEGGVSDDPWLESFQGEAKGLHKRVLKIWAMSNVSPFDIGPEPFVNTPDEFYLSAARGIEVFTGDKRGACTKCHVNYGRGEFYKFDETGGISKARDLTLPNFRGGITSRDLYHRILGGIPLSGMPSHERLVPPVEEFEKNPQKHDLWDLVHFVQAITQSRHRSELKRRFQFEME